MPDEFSGKTALVTGASRGDWSGHRHRVGAARRVPRPGSLQSPPEGALETLAQVRAAGADGAALGADLATLAGIESLLAQLPEIDILINNAGSLVRRARLLEFTPQL